MTDVFVCCGVGGAGKTTAAAALAVAHARAGRHVVVLTIDPARRLADALGISALSNAPTPIALPDASGSLHALMLDRKATWDEVVTAQAPDDDTASRLLANPYYEALSTRLSGGHEYMATEKLYALVQDGRWDLVVIDTPPSQHALDFFRAPERITRILDPRLLGALFRHNQGLMGAATRRVVDVVRRLAGDRVIGDLADFFGLVSGMSEGLRQHGEAVQALLTSPACRYLLVAHADHPQRDDLDAFLQALRADGRTFHGYVLARVVPPLSAPLPTLIDGLPDPPEGVTTEAWQGVVDALTHAAKAQEARADAHAQTARALLVQGGAPVWTAPDLRGGVADLDDLSTLGDHLPPAAPAYVPGSIV